MKAPAPDRSYDTVRITVGMIGIPVSVFTVTTDGPRTSASYSEAGNPVGIRHYDKVTGQELTRDQIVSMVNTPSGPVYVDPAEVEAALDLPAKTIAIKQFYPLSYANSGQFLAKAYRSLEPAMVKTKKGGRDSLSAQQQLSALLLAMDTRQVMAFGEFITRGRCYPVLIFPDGQMWELYYEDNIRAARESKLVDVPDDMLADALEMVDRLAGTDEPDLTDQRTAQTMAFATAKASGLTLIEGEAGEPAPDLMQALKDSIVAARATRQTG